MAYVADTSTIDPNAPPLGAPAGNAPQNLPPAPMTSSGAPGTSGAVSAGSGQGVSATPTSGAQPPVQNLQDYLTANAPQAVAMGSKIGQNLTTRAGEITGDIGADLAATDAQVQASNVAPNADLVTRAAADPSSFVQNPNDLAAFLAQENANYAGPSSIEGTPEWQSLSNEVSNAVAGAPDVSQPGAFLQLAAGQENNPTTGMTNLDAALLSETPGAAQPIMDASKPYKALSGQMTDAASAEDAAIAAAQNNAKTASGLIAPAFTTGPNAIVPAWEKALSDQLTKAQQGQTTYNTTVGKTTSDINALTPQVAQISAILKALGMPDISMSNAGLDPITGSPTMGTVATQADYAKEAALEKLLGSGFSPELIGANAGEAGTFSLPTAPIQTTQQRLQPALNALVNEQLDASRANGNDWGGAGMPGKGAYDSGMSSLYQYLAKNFPELVKAVPGVPGQQQLADTSGLETINIGGKTFQFNPGY